MRILGDRSLPFPAWVPLAVAVGLSLIGVLGSAIPPLTREGRTFHWWFDGAPTPISYGLWALGTPVLYALYRRLDPQKRSWPKTLALWFLTGIAVSGVQMLLATGIFLLPGYLENPGDVRMLVAHFLPSMLVGWVSALLELTTIVGAFCAIDFYQRFRHQQLEVAEARRQLSESQLSALRMQLHPHFLFNALHSISALMEENVEEAQGVLARLGSLLRRMLESDQEPKIPLSQELDYLRNYLDIERIRFKDRLTVRYDFIPESLDALVPNLILQPLVENAIKHGFSRKIECGVIELSGMIVGDTLSLVVRDDGEGFADLDPLAQSPGIGLRNVHDRLARYFGDEGKLVVDSPGGKGCVARIELPLERECPTVVS